MQFDSLGLSQAILTTLSKQNYTEPSPIQAKAIPEILRGKDVIGIAQTGSGKTASFVLPLLMKVLGSQEYKNRHIKALIMTPTRELAVQVHQVIQLFSSNLPRRIKSMAVHGGVSINPQMIGLQNVEILVATPGRLLDLVQSKAMHLSEVSTFVMDEADKLLNLGFQKEIDEVLRLLPAKKQSLLFSATLSAEVTKIQKLLLRDPVLVSIESEKQRIDLIQQIAYKVTEDRKGPLLRYLIKDQKMNQVLVFTSSGRKADQVSNKLVKNGINARAIHGKLSQGARTAALASFKSKETNVLVATDLLSRGIDIDALPVVINYELPRSPKDYVHRIGRTGRAGATGVAIAILTEDDLHHFKVIQKKIGLWADVTDASDIELHGY